MSVLDEEADESRKKQKTIASEETAQKNQRIVVAGESHEKCRETG